MRILDIAVFMLVFTMSLGALDSLGMFSGAVSTNNTTVNITADVSELTPSNATLTGIQIWTLWSMLVKAWDLLSKALSAAFLTGYYLKQLVPIIPNELATMITVTVNVVYILGFVQFITNRAFKMMK